MPVYPRILGTRAHVCGIGDMVGIFWVRSDGHTSDKSKHLCRPRVGPRDRASLEKYGGLCLHGPVWLAGHSSSGLSYLHFLVTLFGFKVQYMKHLLIALNGKENEASLDALHESMCSSL